MKKQIKPAEVISALTPSMAALVLIEGICVLLGWIFDLPWLKNPFPAETPVAVSTGICFVLTGMSILALRNGRLQLTKAFSILSFLICAVIFLHYTFQTFDFDQILFREKMGAFGPGRMSPTILFSFCSINVATLLYKNRFHRFVDFLVLFENVLCLTALASHYFEVPHLMRISTVIQMSSPTALAGLLMGWSLLFINPEQGIVRVLNQEGAGGKFARHYLLPTIFAPFIIAKLALLGAQHGLYDERLGTALVVLFVVCCLTSAIWSVASWLDQADRARDEAQEEQTRSVQNTKLILDLAPDAFSVIDASGTLVEWNPAAERLFGWTREETLGKNFQFLMAHDDRQFHLNNVEEYRLTGSNQQLNNRLELKMLRKDGSEIHVECIPFEIKSLGEGKLAAFMHDISSRKESEQRINEFISTVSHELRTPLTSIKGALRLIEGGIAGDVSSEALALVNVASTETERLIRIVNDILDLKKIEAGKLELKMEDFEAAVLGQSAIEGIRGMARDFDIELRQEFNNCNGVLHCDKDRIIQVLHNLLSNAIKFSPEGESVTLRLEVFDAGLRFSVKDNGSGIPESQSHKLFGRFQQLDSSDTRQQGGTGLGLAISKAIVEEHKGKIGFDSRVGEGSTFWFTLPVLSVHSELEPKIAPGVNSGVTLELEKIERELTS